MGATVERGYGAAHKKLRARTQLDVDAGRAYCWRCTKPIAPGTNWDLGHDDDDRTRYRGPEHVGCNRATANRAKPVHADKSRDW